MRIEYAIIIKDKTRLESLIARFNTKSQAKFYIESLGGVFSDYVREHKNFHRSLDNLLSQLSGLIKYKIIERSFLPSFIFTMNQVIIAVGRDGLVANTAKYANGVPIIGVNPDADRYDGVLLPHTPQSCASAITAVLDAEFEVNTIQFAEAKLNDGQNLLAFNDIFIGAANHVSARYKISFNKKTEEHSSSGIIVSTKAGSTGWLSSIFNMAFGITAMFGQEVKKQQPSLKQDQLLFAVREPFKSIRTQIDINSGIINNTNYLKIESLMPSGGVIFSDGIQADYLHFNSGSIAEIKISNKEAKLVL